MSDKELDRILDRLPRTHRLPLNAIVAINDAGDLEIWLEGGGVLTLPEKQLDYLKGDDVL